MRLCKYLAWSLCLLLTAVSARGQGSNVNANFRFYGMGNAMMPPGLVYKEGDRYKPVALIMAMVSQDAYTYAGPRTLQFFIEGRPAARLDFKGYVDGAQVRATALCTFQDRRAFVVVGQALATEFDAETVAFDTILRSFKLR